jgi:hypothetical protein
MTTDESTHSAMARSEGPGTDPVRPEPEYDVPAGDTPAATCRHCGRPFRSERALALHLDEVHPESLDVTEQAAAERARELEADELFFYHAKVVGALGAIYSVTVILYMVAFTSGLL